MSFESGMSPADLAAVTGSNRNDDGWGGNGSWWIILFLIFAFCGWGGNGWGNNAGNGTQSYPLQGYATQAEMQRGFDTQTLNGTLNNIENAIYNGFDRVTNNTNQGFSGLNTAVVTNGYETRNAITQDTIAGMQNANAIQSQLASCCCDTREAISGVNYNMAMNANATQRAIENGFAQTGYNAATNTCAITTGVSNAARDIVDNANCNTRAILDALNAQAIAAKDAKIAEQSQQIFGLQLAASQSAQNQYLVSQIRPAPVPAFTVPTPYQFGGCVGCGC